MLPQTDSDSDSPDDHRHLTRLLCEFVQSWQPGALASAVRQLQALPSSLRAEGLRELACADLTKCWESGLKSSAQDYLRSYPELATDPQAVQVLRDEETRLGGVATPADALAIDTPTVAFPCEESTDNDDDSLAPAGPTPNDADDSFRQTIGGRYQIVAPLGNGGMGALFIAWDPKLERRVALKFPLIHDPRQRPELVQRFLREARLLGGLNHPNLCAVYDTGEDGLRPFMVMRLIAGKTLREFLDAREQPMPVADAVALVRDVALALEVVHCSGIQHRDLKPGNIMLELKTGRPIVIDFGLARTTELESSLQTSDGRILGTVPYMAPEQVRADASKQGPRTDIFSLGVILFELLSGRRPFPGNTLSDLFDQIRDTIPAAPSTLRPEVGPTLDDICGRALAKQPEDRFQSMADFAAALEQCLNHSTDRHAELPRRTVTRSRRIAVPSLVIVAVCAVIGLLAAFREHWMPGGSGDSTVKLDPGSRPPTETDPSKKDSGSTRSSIEERTVPIRAGDERDDNELQMKFCWCPPGRFMMGSRPGEGNPEFDGQVPVTLTRGFWIGKYEVTQAQFERIMGSNPSAYSKEGPHAAEVEGLETSQFPVESVERAQARVFCRNFTSMERRAGRIGDHDEFTLPTEAQWEYACRAGSLSVWMFGQSPTLRQANFGGGVVVFEGALRRTSIVGQYPANAWGIHDMSGNVWEWVLDWHQPKVPGGTDPAVTQDNSDGREVIRGGSWTDHPGALVSTSRGGMKATHSYWNLGFRMALVSRRSDANDSTTTRPDPAASPPVIENSIGMKLRKIEPGEFQMGQAADEGQHRPKDLIRTQPLPTGDHEVQHRVTLTKGFRIGVTEVTQRQWKAVMQSTPWLNRKMSVDGDDYPATYATWFEANDFCRELGKREGRRYRLPTEAEWEYCCRAGTQTAYSFGNDSALLGDHAWYRWIANDLPHPVARKEPNPWGLYDMHGNVAEWCRDWVADYSSKPVIDPVGPAGGEQRVLRGGGFWHLYLRDYRSAFRGSTPPGAVLPEHGFRVVLDDDDALAERNHKTVNERLPEMKPGNDERAAVAWVLQQGGHVTVEVGSEQRDVAAGGRLPEEEFRLINANLSKQPKLMNSDLSRLRGLGHLRSLSLFHSPVTDEGLKRIGLPASLTQLHLEATNVTDESISLIASLTNLTELMLSDTLVTERGVLQLQSLKSLKHVEFGHLPWSVPIMEMLSEWPELQTLGVSRQWIRSDAVAVWATHPCLTNLFIRGDLGHEQLQLLQKMENLQFLVLQNNQTVDGEMLRDMNRLPKLNFVAIMFSPLEPATLREIRALPRLKKFSLQHGPYTDEHLAALLEADNLELLQLFGTQITPAGVSQFKTAHPRCRVETDIPEQPEPTSK